METVSCNKSFFSFERAIKNRANAIEGNIAPSLYILREAKSGITLQPANIEFCRKSIDSYRLNYLQILTLKIINFVQKLFNSNETAIDRLLSTNRGATLLSNKCYEILHHSKFTPTSSYKDKSLSENTREALCYLNFIQFNQLKELIEETQSKKDYFGKKELKELYSKSPKFLYKILVKMTRKRFGKSLKKHPELLFKSGASFPSILEDIKNVVKIQSEAYLNLTKISTESDKVALHKQIETNNKIFSTSPHSKNTVYDVSAEAVFKDISREVLEKPITVTMVGIEYAGFAKEGGLAEAIEGMSQGLLEQHRDNRVKLIFPKFSHMPKKVLEQLKEPKIYKIASDSYKVYELEHNGVECFFIEDSSFDIKGEKPSIYGPNAKAMSERFSKFSELAADLITQQKDTDIIHIHDWHAAGTGLKLKNDDPKNWSNGKIPPIVFTFHNNNRVAQGRLFQGHSRADSLATTFNAKNILKPYENLFISAIASADSVTTVSETFGLEAQEYLLGEGASFIIREAAKAGKLAGIINGVNLQRWNPETDASLVNWKDIDTNAPTKLSYAPTDLDLLETKAKAKVQLNKWLAKYMPDVKLDPSKPLITYVGRFDSYQKGLDKLDEAISTTLKNGGQFVVMGMGEDPIATDILDKLEKKYKDGVLFIRDYKDSNGRIHFQQGNDERPGIGSLIRACSDFIFAPSRFEPCGLIQFEGWLFGSLVIASKVGGLADTVISPEKDSETFNGFTFDRNQNGNTGLKSVIKNALSFWNNQSPEEKTGIIKRVMQDGRQYGWHKSPRGLTPAEKYRLSYENAKRFSKLRDAKTRNLYSTNTIAREKGVSISFKDWFYHKLSGTSSEETYLKELYKGEESSSTLERLYQKIPEGSRATLPSPYGINTNFENYKEYGAFATENQTRFKIYAPHAKNIELHLYDDDENLEKIVALTRSADDNNYEIHIDQNLEGKKYRFCVNGQMKIDPYGRYQIPSKHQGVEPFSVVDSSKYSWKDTGWIEKREHTSSQSTPMSIYELHPTTWIRDGSDKPLSYQDLAHKLVKHCKEMGYTHVEPMALLEHPFEGSMGYHVTGFFSPNHRLGSVKDFKEFVDILHQNDIGVILDWVPAHFAKDKYSLEKFDGSSLYEARGLRHLASIRNLFLGFGAHQFDFSRQDVRDFLISSAAFWINEMHIDGLRVDCVRSILSSENQKDAQLFLKDLNAVVHSTGRGAITIAEDFSGSTPTTESFWQDGLGFDMKWHVSLSYGLLEHIQKTPADRKAHYKTLKNAMLSDQRHNQLVFLSHDNLFNQSMMDLLKKVPENQRLASLKSLLSILLTSPGKKLLFMGSDEGVTASWKSAFTKLHGYLNDESLKDKDITKMVSQLNKIYRSYQENWEFDSSGRDLQWIEDPSKTVHAYRREASNGSSSAIFHNTSNEHRTMRVLLSDTEGLALAEIFNSDADIFGGQNRVNQNITLEQDESTSNHYYNVTIPPLTSIIIKEK